MGLFDRFRGRLPGSRPPTGGEDLRDRSVAARGRYWSQVGEVEDDVLGTIISPSFMGGARWPTLRQAYRVVRRGGAVLLASDGLSDPAGDPHGGRAGLGLELFLETSDIPAEASGVGRLSATWAMAILYRVSNDVAGLPDIVERLDRLGALSIESAGVSEEPALAGLPARFISDDDALGVLIGGVPADFPQEIADMPAPVRTVPLVLLTAAELARMREGGSVARREIAQALARSSTGHRSSLVRESVA